MTKIKMYSPVPSPTGTKETYWETKAPGSEVFHLTELSYLNSISLFTIGRFSALARVSRPTTMRPSPSSPPLLALSPSSRCVSDSAHLRFTILSPLFTPREPTSYGDAACLYRGDFCISRKSCAAWLYRGDAQNSPGHPNIRIAKASLSQCSVACILSKI